MSKSPFYPIDIQPGDVEEVVDGVNNTFLDVKKTLDTIGIAKGVIVSVADSGTADAEFAVNHGLGVIPDGYIKVRSDKACAIYDGGTAWDANNIYLKCDVSNVALEIMVIIYTN